MQTFTKRRRHATVNRQEFCTEQTEKNIAEAKKHVENLSKVVDRVEYLVGNVLTKANLMAYSQILESTENQIATVKILLFGKVCVSQQKHSKMGYKRCEHEGHHAERAQNQNANVIGNRSRHCR